MNALYSREEEAALDREEIRQEFLALSDVMLTSPLFKHHSHPEILSAAMTVVLDRRKFLEGFYRNQRLAEEA